MKFFSGYVGVCGRILGDHPQHVASVKLLKSAPPKTTACAAFHNDADSGEARHSAGASSLVHSLTDAEYSETVERLAEKGIARSSIFDGLIMTAAAKSEADVIYTWGVDGFQLVSTTRTSKKVRTP